MSRCSLGRERARRERREARRGEERSGRVRLRAVVRPHTHAQHTHAQTHTPTVTLRTHSLSHTHNVPSHVSLPHEHTSRAYEAAMRSVCMLDGPPERRGLAQAWRWTAESRACPKFVGDVMSNLRVEELYNLQVSRRYGGTALPPRRAGDHAYSTSA